MLNRWQRTIVDLRGNVVPYAQLQIRVESTQATATIYADRAGNELIPNGIVTADADGYAFFYAEADLYRISSMQPTIDWRYVDIGSANAVRIATEALDENLVTYPTLAELEADTTRDVNSMGRVVNDGSNNGYYLWNGTTWVRTSYQPMQRDEFDDLVLHVENDFLRKDIEQSAPLLRDIPQMGVVGLPYDVDQLYAQIWAARYPGFPAPSAHFEFGAGARLLSPDLTFSRSTPAWYWKNGVLVEAGIDEPVFEDGALRLEPQATNYVEGTEDMYANWSYQPQYYDSAPAESVFGAGYTAVEHTKISTAIPLRDLAGDIPSNLLGRQISVTVLIEADLGALEGDIFRVSLYNNSARADHTVRSIGYRVGTDNGISLEELNAIGPNGHPLYRIHAEFEAPDDGDTYRLYVYMFRNIGSTGVVHHWQVTEGDFPQSPIITPTGGTATRAADSLTLEGAAFGRIYNPNGGAVLIDHEVLSGKPISSNNTYAFIFQPNWLAVRYRAHGSGSAVRYATDGELPPSIPRTFKGRSKTALSYTPETVSFAVNGEYLPPVAHQENLQSQNTLVVGSPYGSQGYPQVVKSLTLFTKPLTQNEMEALTHA